MLALLLMMTGVFAGGVGFAWLALHYERSCPSFLHDLEGMAEPEEPEKRAIAAALIFLLAVLSMSGSLIVLSASEEGHHSIMSLASRIMFLMSLCIFIFRELKS